MAPRFVFTLAFLAVLSLVAADGQLSLGADQGFMDLRECAVRCYNGGVHPGWMLTNKLDCRKPGVQWIPPDNDCFCRPDLQQTAVQHLSTCAYTYCSQNDRDIASATQVYKDYCNGAGYTADEPNSNDDAQTTGADSATQATDSSDSPDETGDSRTNQPSDNNDDNPSDSNSSGGGGGSSLSIGAIVGIAAGAISAIAGVIGCIIKYKSYKKQQQLAKEQQQQQQQHHQEPYVTHQQQYAHWK